MRAQLRIAKGESYKVCYDERCQIEIGKALAAEKTIATKLVDFGNECALSGTIYDLKTEAAEKAAVVRIPCSSSVMVDALDNLVGQLR